MTDNRSTFWVSIGMAVASSRGTFTCLIACGGQRDFYFEEIRVFTAGMRLEYISME